MNPAPPLLDRSLLDDVVAVPEAEARTYAQRMGREGGLLLGASGGLNLGAARRVAKERGPDGVVVTVGVDTGFKYLAGALFTS